jgi:hypothetical protein
MLLALALQAATPQTAVDAERAFNAAAQAKGQWTAFREFAAEDAIVFVPQPAKAREALPTKNPPIAVQWWPAESYVSCDGTMAVNTGPWMLPKGFGYFTTVWVKQPDGAWKWVMDGGDALAKPRVLPEKPRVRTASCASITEPTATPVPPLGAKGGDGQSADGTLLWHWQVAPDGARRFDAWMWNGRTFASVVANEVAAAQ